MVVPAPIIETTEMPRSMHATLELGESHDQEKRKSSSHGNKGTDAPGVLSSDLLECRMCGECVSIGERCCRGNWWCTTTATSRSIGGLVDTDEALARVLQDFAHRYM